MTEVEVPMNSIKIAIVGDIATGKTSILNRLMYNTFTEEYVATIAGELSSKDIMLGGVPVKCQFWDTTGEERFRSLCKIFYQGAMIIFVVYDVSERKTFESIKEYWIGEIKDNTRDTLICIVGNKADLLPFKVDEEEARDFTKSINGHFALVSSKNGNGVQELLEESIKIVVDKYGIDILKKDKQSLDPQPKPNPEKNKGCC